MKTILKLWLAFSVIGILTTTVNAQYHWPDDAKAAVVFTYDDGLDCHLDVAVPQLDQFGLKGTFYCTGHSNSLHNRLEDWREIARQGHELGNHTLFHPCDGKRFDWVKDEYDLNNYSIEQFMNELHTANTLLKAIDGKENRTFAYTCSDYVAGGTDFTGELNSMFLSARKDGPIPVSMKSIDVYQVPSWGVNEPTAEELIAYVNEAKEKGTIAVFMFHSVGGGYLNVGADEHRKLLQYVKDNEHDFYSATFLEVMEYVKNQLD